MNAKQLIEAAKEIAQSAAEYSRMASFIGRVDADEKLWWEQVTHVADHILATVRADDDEPVSMKWIEALGINEITIGMKQMHYLPQDMLIGYHGKTRGQFRALCVGLGIELKEVDCVK